MYTNNWKNGYTLTVKEKQVTRDGGEKSVNEVIIHENIPAYVLKVNGSTFSRELAQMTDTDKIVIKVGRKRGITKRMKAYLSHKDMGLMGAYSINEVEPKTKRGVLLGFYIHLERSNEG